MREHIIRIFVSSTFEDMKIERNILRDKVFPQLSMECREKGWLLEYVDLRWGISKEASDNNNTMQICLEELRRSQQLSPRPNFLVLYGEHSGWHPSPEILSADTFARLQEAATSEREKRMLLQCYQKDTNSIPAHYWLKCKDEEGLMPVLLQRVQKAYPHNCEIERLLASATMQEIYAGALEVEDANDHVLAYVRTFSNPRSENLGKYRDIDHNEWSVNLKKIRSRLDSNNLIEANLDYARYTSHDYDNAIYEQLYKHVKRIVDNEISSFAQRGELESELLSNQEFMTSTADQFVGREELIEILLSEITKKSTVLLEGESGTGKTALMAKLSAILKAKNNKVAYVFIGNTPNLTRGDFMAKMIAAQLPDYDARQETFAPADLYQLLSKASPSHPTYIFIDSLDSLQVGDVFRKMAWLPEMLHSNIHVVCSQVPSSEISPYSYTSKLDIPKLSCSDGINLILSDLTLNHRCMTKDQRKVVERMLEIGEHTPLYVKLLSHIILQLRSSENLVIAETIKQLNSKDLFGYIVNSLTARRFHDERLVRLYLQALSMTFYGISDDEMSEFLAGDELYYERLQKDSFHQLQQKSGRVVPPIIISRLKSELKVLLTTSLVEDRLVYRWRHKLLAKLSTEYLLGLPEYKSLDRNMALNALRAPLHKTYMQQMREGNVHAVYELQHLLTYIEDYFDLFTDLEYLSKRISNALTDKLGYIYRSTTFGRQDKNSEWDQIRNFEVEASRYYNKNYDAYDYMLKWAYQYSPSCYIGQMARNRYAEQVKLWSDNLLYRDNSTYDALKPIFKPIVNPCAICDDGYTAYGVENGKIWQMDLIKNTISEVRFNNLGYVISMKCVGNNAQYWAVLSAKRFIMLYDRQANKVLNVIPLRDYIMDKNDPKEFHAAKPQDADGDAYYLSYCDPVRLALQYQDGTIEVWEGNNNLVQINTIGSYKGRLACISGNGEYYYVNVWDNDQYGKFISNRGDEGRETKHKIERYSIIKDKTDVYSLNIDFHHELNTMAASENGNILIHSEGGYISCMWWNNGKSGYKMVHAHNHRADLNHNRYAVSPDGRKAFSYGETDGAIITYNTEDMNPKVMLIGNMSQMYNAIFSHSTRFAFISVTCHEFFGYMHRPNWYILDTERDMLSLSNLIRSGVYSMDIWNSHLLFSVGGDCVSDCDSTVYHMDLNTRKITPLVIPQDDNRESASHNISFSRDGHIVLFTRGDTVFVFKDFQYVTCHKVMMTVQQQKTLDENDCSVRNGDTYCTHEGFHSLYRQYNVPLAEFVYSDKHPMLQQLPIVPCKLLGYYIRKKENGVLIYPRMDNPGFAYFFRV